MFITVYLNHNIPTHAIYVSRFDNSTDDNICDNKMISELISLKRD